MTQATDALRFGVSRSLSLTCSKSVIAAIMVASCAGYSSAADQSVNYVRDVQPILRAKCYRCHGAAKQEGGLRLDTAPLARRGGDSGSAIDTKEVAASLLIKRVTATAESDRMPPDGTPLSAQEIDLLRSWIQSGAVAPSDEKPQLDPKLHWAFQVPQRSLVRHQEPGRNSVDQFLALTRASKGISSVVPSSRSLLLRRVFVDLIGVPPTADELRAFLSDESPDAYDGIVEQLLADPRHGERWGRHWMDVWRYSDWDGYAAEVRESKPHIWRWRDWIVESLNSGKPYNQMIVEMLAADEVSPDDPDALRATGFLVRHWFRYNRNVWLDNAVEHTGKAFLGLTFNCAKCHDHMYDPLTQPEYFQLRALFEPYDVRTDRLPGEADRDKFGLVRAFDANATQPTFLFVRGDEAQPVKDKPIPPALPSLFKASAEIQPVTLSAQAYYPGLQPFIQEEERQKANNQLARAEQEVIAAKNKLAEVEKQAEAAKSAATNSPELPAFPANAVIADDFKVARPELWNSTKGKWEHRDGRLIQADAETGMGTLVSKTPHPVNFEVTFRFKTTGGKMWKSVGLGFDAHDEANYHSVYLSAYAGGAKLQIAHTVAGQTTYPSEGLLALPIEMNRDLELQVVVRDQLANVRVNGALCLVYRIPAPRKAGGPLTLWTYDATAEFSRCVVTPLTENKPLREEAPTAADLQQAVAGVKSAPVQLDAEALFAEARQAVDQAERLQRAEQANVRLIDAVIAADSAKYGASPADQLRQKELAQAASHAERVHALALAEAQLGNAEQTLSKAKRAAKPGDAKTQKAVTDAEADLAKKQLLRDSAVGVSVNTVNEQYKGLSETYPTTSTGRRSMLARWIASRDNPLTARVAVNHLWMRHFGTPLVTSVFDFGLNGKAPTHPELLDWLAVEFMDSGWDMKHLHRLMVLSDAYRLASSAPESTELVRKNLASDPENLTLWRFNARRLEAEAVRDATLHVAGSLEHQPGGPDLDPNLGLTSGRRSLYFRSSKEKRMTFTSLFDGPNVSECYRRSESIAPQQALAMANSGLTLAQSRILAGKLADRVLSESNNSDRGWLNSSPGQRAYVSLAFEHLLNRVPSDVELDECATFLTEQAQSHADASKLTRFKTAATSNVAPAAEATQRARENLIHVLLNHHEFVTVR